MLSPIQYTLPQRQKLYMLVRAKASSDVITAVRKVFDLENELAVLKEELLQEMANVRLKQGPPGTDGKSIVGPQGEAGVQGTTGAQGARGLTGERGMPGLNGIDGRPGIDGKDGLVGIAGKDGNIKELSPDEIRDSLEIITTEDEKLKIDAVGFLRKELDELKERLVVKNYGGGYSALSDMPDMNLRGLSDDQSIKWDRSAGKWVPYTPSGGVGAWSTPAETVNGVTAVFTVGATIPTDLVVDGVTLFENQGFTFAASQVTLTNPAAVYVRYR